MSIYLFFCDKGEANVELDGFENETQQGEKGHCIVLLGVELARVVMLDGSVMPVPQYGINT